MTPDGRPLQIRLTRRPIVRLRVTKNAPPEGTELTASFLDVSGRSRGGGSAFYVGGEIHLEVHDAESTQVALTWKHLRGGPVFLPLDLAEAIEMPLRRVEDEAPQPGSPGTTIPSIPVVDGWIRGRVAPMPPGGVGAAMVHIDGGPRAPVQPGGWFHLDALPGRHELRIATWELKGPVLEVVVLADRTVDVVLAPPEGGVPIVGHVRDRKGAPVPGVLLQASREDAVFRWEKDEVRTDKNGRFWFHYLTDGRYELASVRDKDAQGAVETVKVDVGGPAVELLYLRHGFVRGRIAGDWPKRPAMAFWFHVDRLDDKASVSWADSVRAQPDGEGFYFEARLPAGRYRFTPPRDTRWARTPDEFEIEEGAEAPTVELVVEGE